MRVVRLDELPSSGAAHELVGADHDVDVSLIFVDAAPGRGPTLHKHGYPEVFITLAGRALFVAGDEQREVGAGEIVIVPPDTPHRFENSGSEPLRQINIHVSPRFMTEWLTDAAEPAGSSE